MLRRGQFTSLITNFERVPLDSIQIFQQEDLVIYHRASKRLRRIESIDDNSQHKSSQNEGSIVSKGSSDTSEEEKDSDNECPSDRLFIGVIDINKCEEDTRRLYNKLLNEGENYRTDFWAKVNTSNDEKKQMRLPNTIEELKETQKVLDKVDNQLQIYDKFMPKNQYFKPHSANAKRFLENAEFINKQLSIYDTNLKCISSFLGIEERQFTKLLKYYSKPRENSIKNFLQKQSDKARFDSEIAEELKKFISTRIGRWVTTRMMRNHLLNVFNQRIDDDSERNFRLSSLSPYNVRRILRNYLDYTWRKSKQRAPRSIGNFTQKRVLFAELIKKLESLGFNIVYVDEASVWPQNITLYSWCHKYIPDPIIRPSTLLNMIAAMILPHKYSFMLKNGSTKSEHIIFFFEQLHNKLWDWFGDEYIKSTIIVFDNASIHISNCTKTYLKYKMLSVLTLPPYTPEQNDVEQVFKRLKTDLSRQDFSKKRLEYIITETIMLMK